jgi:hypothetical protein
VNLFSAFSVLIEGSARKIVYQALETFSKLKLKKIENTETLRALADLLESQEQRGRVAFLSAQALSKFLTSRDEYVLEKVQKCFTSEASDPSTLKYLRHLVNFFGHQK